MNIGSIFSALLKGVLSILKIALYLIIPLVILLIIFILILIFNYWKYRFVDGIKPKGRFTRKYFTYKGKKYYIDIPRFDKPKKKESTIHKLFISFPKQLSHDFLSQDPNDFDKFGIYMIVGEQGSGKSMTAIYLIEQWREMYPNLRVYTNMGYVYEDGELSHWKQLIERKNGKFGVINVIDDIQPWWSNKDSGKLPPEVMGEICQQRKQKKALIGTIQVFSECPKELRIQTHFIYVPKTYLGCLTIVRRTKAKDYDPDKDRFKKYYGTFFFVHNEHLRSCYDTYKKIEKYKDVEFDVSPYWSSDKNVDS